MQRIHSDAKTPEELLAAIADAAPVEGVILQKMTGVSGWWTFNKAAVDTVPRLDWGRLLAEGAAACSELQPASGSAASSKPPSRT